VRPVSQMALVRSCVRTLVGKPSGGKKEKGPIGPKKEKGPNNRPKILTLRLSQLPQSQTLPTAKKLAIFVQKGAPYFGERAERIPANYFFRDKSHYLSHKS